jgi:hypothetical protein
METTSSIDYAQVLANLGATDNEINDLLAEDDENTTEDALAHVSREYTPANLGERTCETCGAVVLELPHCAMCGDHDDRVPF